jgi:hypothetical protein
MAEGGKRMKAAVLSDAGLHFDGADVRAVNTKELNTLAELLELAETAGCVQLWILPGSKLFERLRRHHKKLFNCPGTDWNFAPRELSNMVTGWRNNLRYQIIFPGAVTQHWPLELITEPRDLLFAIKWLINQTGVYPSVPTRTARKIVEASIKKPLLPADSMDIFAEHKAPDIDYLREPTIEDAGRKYVHAFDKNNMYLSACAIPLGDGDWTAWCGKKFDRNFPGLWEAKITGGHPTFRQLLNLRGDEGWFYTPSLALAEDLGFTVDVGCAYVFPRTRKVLEDFYQTIRRALILGSGLAGPELVAAKSLKPVYTHFIGWLARNTGENGQAFWRPDWRSLIVDEANARLLRNVFKVYSQTGELPFGIRRDCLLYFSDEPFHAAALPAPLTGDGAAYKHVYTFKAGEVLKLMADGYSIHRLDTELKRRWKEKNNAPRRKRKVSTANQIRSAIV